VPGISETFQDQAPWPSEDFKIVIQYLFCEPVVLFCGFVIVESPRNLKYIFSELCVKSIHIL
jgi:hypothetical protein